VSVAAVSEMLGDLVDWEIERVERLRDWRLEIGGWRCWEINEMEIGEIRDLGDLEIGRVLEIGEGNLEIGD